MIKLLKKIGHALRRLKLPTCNLKLATLALCLSAAVVPSAQAQWFNSLMSCSNVTTLPMLNGFAARTVVSTFNAPAETLMVTNANTNDTYTGWYWTPQYGQGPAGAANNGAPNLFPLATITTNFTAAALAALGQTNGSGLATNGGTVFWGIPAVNTTTTNQLYGTFSNSAWTVTSGRTNGVQSSP